jgi:DMSO/TMAO reductase YedYZ molybdopterin-dependent catalytic subunit
MNRREFLRVAAGGVVLFFQTACQSTTPSPPPSSNPPLTIGATPPVQSGAPTVAPNLAQLKLPLPIPLDITPIEHFYVTSYSDTIPGFDPKLWSFGLDGLVANPLKFTFDELYALPQIQVMRTLECIGNPVGGTLISNGTWKGVLLKELLKQANAKANAQYLIIDGADDYFTTVPFDIGLTDEALLVYELNGQPLTPQHGRPLRALFPGVYGQKQPKWITHIEVTDHSEKGPWEKKGWSDTAIIHPNSRIDRPLDGNTITGKPGDVFTITGIAFTSSPGVARVEVSVDDGKTWSDATLTRAPAPFTHFVWTPWGFDWTLPESGKYSLLARVTDNAGKGQGTATAGLIEGVFPDGTDHIQVIVVEVKSS